MFLFFTHQCVFFNKFIINKNIFLFIKMNKILIYIFITILLIICITNLKSISKSNEKYDSEKCTIMYMKLIGFSETKIKQK